MSLGSKVEIPNVESFPGIHVVVEGSTLEGSPKVILSMHNRSRLRWK
jgi:hypothetical protein